MKKKQPWTWLGIGLVVVVLVGLGSGYYHHTHFNQNVKINGIKVSGLTVEQAYQKIKATKVTNRVYLNNHLVFDGKDSQPVYGKDAKKKLSQMLAKQASVLPSDKQYNFVLAPQNTNKLVEADMKATLEFRLGQLNEGKKLPVDAKAVWHNNKVSVIEAKQGTALDQEQVLKDFAKEKFAPTIRLTAKVKKPLSSQSTTVQKEKQALKKLNNGSVKYQVAGHNYQVKATEVIKEATYQNGKYQFTPIKAATVIQKINAEQATLGKKFKFKTHDGKVITTAADGDYGWKIMTSRAADTIGNAIVKKQASVDAKADIYGQGYDTRGIGYGVTQNDGLGNTYAEVSIADQHAWFYRDGKLVASADVVTGKHSTGDDTPKGVWYIMYQQMHTTLRGTGDNGKPYASPVTYWSPFTLSGCGFHDASWRHNWSSSAYLNDGSNGCVNMHPADAGTAFKALSVKEPVIIY